MPQVPIEDLSLEAFQSVLNVNLVGPFLFTREAVRTFKAQSPQGGQFTFGTLLIKHTANGSIAQVESLTTAPSLHTSRDRSLRPIPARSMPSRG